MLRAHFFENISLIKDLKVGRRFSKTDLEEEHSRRQYRKQGEKWSEGRSEMSWGPDDLGPHWKDFGFYCE